MSLFQGELSYIELYNVADIGLCTMHIITTYVIHDVDSNLIFISITNMYDSYTILYDYICSFGINFLMILYDATPLLRIIYRSIWVFIDLFQYKLEHKCNTIIRQLNF